MEALDLWTFWSFLGQIALNHLQFPALPTSNSHSVTDVCSGSELNHHHGYMSKKGRSLNDIKWRFYSFPQHLSRFSHFYAILPQSKAGVESWRAPCVKMKLLLPLKGDSGFLHKPFLCLSVIPSLLIAYRVLIPPHTHTHTYCLAAGTASSLQVWELLA